MTEVGTRDTPLSWDVFMTPGIPIVTSEMPPVSLAFSSLFPTSSYF
jgi:hypothetical protein